MIDFICEKAQQTWDIYILFNQWFENSISTNNWAKVIVGTILVAIAFVINRLRCFSCDGDSKEDGFLPTEAWGIVGFGFIFIVQFFNEFMPWYMVSGLPGLFAWVGVLFHMAYICILLCRCAFLTILSLWGFFEFIFSGFSINTALSNFKYMRPVIGLILSFPLLSSGLLLTSAVTGPILTVVFILACIFMPTSNKVGTFEDRNGRTWEVWRH